MSALSLLCAFFCLFFNIFLPFISFFSRLLPKVTKEKNKYSVLLIVYFPWCSIWHQSNVPKISIILYRYYPRLKSQFCKIILCNAMTNKSIIIFFNKNHSLSNCTNHNSFENVDELLKLLQWSTEFNMYFFPL
jgi:hypothetical protein